jgi:hypothetical protein
MKPFLLHPSAIIWCERSKILATGHALFVSIYATSTISRSLLHAFKRYLEGTTLFLLHLLASHRCKRSEVLKVGHCSVCLRVGLHQLSQEASSISWTLPQANRAVPGSWRILSPVGWCEGSKVLTSGHGPLYFLQNHLEKLLSLLTAIPERILLSSLIL